jgi:hypothetical protein
MRRFVPALAIAACLILGCGGSNSSSSDASTPDKTAPFLGPWTVSVGAVMGTCPVVGMIDYKLDGSVQAISKGTDSDLAVTLLAGCTVKMDVMGTVATLRTTPPQTCTLMLPNGLPVMATFTSGMFNVADQRASFTFSGTGALGMLSCPVTGTGMSLKGAPADGGAPAADGATAGSDGP